MYRKFFSIILLTLLSCANSESNNNSNLPESNSELEGNWKSNGLEFEQVNAVKKYELTDSNSFKLDKILSDHFEINFSENNKYSLFTDTIIHNQGEFKFKNDTIKLLNDGEEWLDIIVENKTIDSMTCLIQMGQFYSQFENNIEIFIGRNTHFALVKKN